MAYSGLPVRGAVLGLWQWYQLASRLGGFFGHLRVTCAMVSEGIGDTLDPGRFGNQEELMNTVLLMLKIWKDRRAQDLIEYALMAGFVAVAAGAIMPGVSTSISKIFSKVASVMTAAAAS